MVARVTMMTGGGGDQIHAYVAQPDGPGPFSGVVLIHHLGGWDEFYREFTRRFAGVEKLAAERGIDVNSAGLTALDALWDEVKRSE